MVLRREKKRMSHDELERHVINWGVERLSDIQEFAYGIEDEDIYSDEKKFVMCSAFVKNVDDLISLLNPLRHESDCLIEWGFNFIDEYGKKRYRDTHRQQ